MDKVFTRFAFSSFLLATVSVSYAQETNHAGYYVSAKVATAKLKADNMETSLRPGIGQFVAGDEYSIADMAIWSWYGGLALGRLYNAAEFLDVQSYKHLQRWATQIDARPAAKRAVKVNRNWGEAHEQLPERHSAADFDKIPKA